MDWQLLTAGLIVLTAAGYLAYRAWRTWNTGKAGCSGGCGCSARTAAAAGNDSAALIAPEQLTLYRRSPASQ